MQFRKLLFLTKLEWMSILEILEIQLWKYNYK